MLPKRDDCIGCLDGGNCRGAMLAVTTIVIDCAQFAFGRLAFIGGMMLMLVMTEVMGCLAAFMLAITARRRPRHLERQCNQQKKEKEAFHLSELYVQSAGCGRTGGGLVS